MRIIMTLKDNARRSYKNTSQPPQPLKKLPFLFENFLRWWVFRYRLVVSLILVMMMMMWSISISSSSSSSCCKGEEGQGEEDEEFYLHPGELWGRQSAVTWQYYHSIDVTLSQLSRTSQWALAHVTTIFYQNKNIKTINCWYLWSVWCVGLLAASESLVHMLGMTDRACLHQTSYYHANNTTSSSSKSIAGWLSE